MCRVLIVAQVFQHFCRVMLRAGKPLAPPRPAAAGGWARQRGAATCAAFTESTAEKPGVYGRVLCSRAQLRDLVTKASQSLRELQRASYTQLVNWHGYLAGAARRVMSLWVDELASWCLSFALVWSGNSPFASPTYEGKVVCGLVIAKLFDYQYYYCSLVPVFLLVSGHSAV